MGTPGGLPGDFSIHSFFKGPPPPSSLSPFTAPSAPYPPGYQPQQGGPGANPSHPGVPFNNYPSGNYSTPGGTSYPSLPPGSYPYNSQQPGPAPPPQAGMQSPGMYNPYMQYPQQDHHGGPRPQPPPYAQGPYPNVPSFPPQGPPHGPPHGTYSQPQYTSSSNQSPLPSFSHQSSVSGSAGSAAPPGGTSGSQQQQQHQQQQQQSFPQGPSGGGGGAAGPGSSSLSAPEPAVSPPLDGAHLMALLTTQSSAETTSKEESAVQYLSTSSLLDLPPGGSTSSSGDRDTSQHPSHSTGGGGGSEQSLPPPALSPALPTAPPVNLAPPNSRLPGSKPPPRGRYLKGEHVVYDVDVRQPFEQQPQLEYSPITVYSSDPVLVLGRQIAVNRTYICYGLRAGTIRILNINTALRVLLRGHSQRVTDMVFFGEDVHLLASASTDGRVFVRKIVEGSSDDARVAIKDHIVLAMQIVGDWDSVHPRVCWHSKNQDILVVGIGKYVLTIDTNKVRVNAPPGGFSAEDAIICDVNTPLEGVHVVGEHSSDVTDLSVPLWVPTCFASASMDGTVRIWGDKKTPLAVFVPHQGQPVNFVSFVSPPRRPDQAVLITAGPLSREVKLWAQAPLDGPAGKPGSGNWQCIQVLELKSSGEKRVDAAFYNQVMVVPRAGVVILANAKKKAIYVVHLEFGPSASSTQMDYLAEFTVAMPILSLTATSEVGQDGDGTVQVYCVQTQAIQQYALELSQCLPSAEDVAMDKSGLLESSQQQVTSQQVTKEVIIPGDTGFSASVTELSTVSLSTHGIGAPSSSSTSGPGPSSLGPGSGASSYGGLGSGSYEQSLLKSSSSETMVATLESTVVVTQHHQDSEADFQESIDSISSLEALGRYSESPSAAAAAPPPPHNVRPVSPAQVPSFLKRPPQPPQQQQQQPQQQHHQSESPTKVSEDGYVLVPTGSGVAPPEPLESAAAQLQQEQQQQSGGGLGGPLDSVLADMAEMGALSAGFEKDDETSSIGEAAPTGTTASTSTSQQQQQQPNAGSSQGGTVHLLSPSELMNLVARSRASEADLVGGPASASAAGATSLSGVAGAAALASEPPSKLEERAAAEEVVGSGAGDSDLDILRNEHHIHVAESDAAAQTTSLLGGKDVRVGHEFDEKSDVTLLDVIKDKPLVNMNSTGLDYNNKEFNWEGSSSAVPNFADPSVDPSAGDEAANQAAEDGEALLDERELLSSSPGGADDILDVKDNLGGGAGGAGGGGGPKTGGGGGVDSATAVSGATAPTQSPAVTKGRKNKNKTNVVPAVASSVPMQSPFSGVPPSLEEGGSSSNANVPPPADLGPGLGYQITAMQESVNQLVATQKELQKQMSMMVAVPMAKEGKRMEGALGTRMEKMLKANLDSMWVRMQEESAKRDKLERERVQQLTNMLSNSFTKDIPASLERVFKKEFATVGPVVARAVTPTIEKTIMTSLTDAFQKGLVEKVIPQLEKVVGTKLETAVTRQVQVQLQQSLRPALQESLRGSFEATVIPGFERSCQAMFEQVDATFQRGFAEHVSNTQQQFDAQHSALAATLQETMLSASSLATSLKGEISEGQRKLIALAESASARASLNNVNQSNGLNSDQFIPLQHVEESLDPTIELSRLLHERKVEEAFTKALSKSDVAIVSWLCSQVDLKALLTSSPPPLSQGVILSLVQQLGCDLGTDIGQKLEWIKEGALAINPEDPVLAPHMRPFLEQLYQNLHRHSHLMAGGGEVANVMRIVLHVVNSLLTACK